ncbi:homocysteine S-methyltransferase [Aquitalea magnusonii]|uniref:S-methylmethionine:homocysteine methyltransferase n=1 Tax=Aquitalea magnusonii TaxID=332411 RepID=A0A3G9GAX1_9NEIS|nr:homocysteine S-methyltransferase [Aquitalea magnusonii]BBF85040.1 homocysteine S-methyltransferase [Aquitalea magnusonii]
MSAAALHLLQQRLHESNYLLLDGALATALEARGFDLADPLWSARVLLEAPQAIGQLHLDYLQAGADIITTSSYQASFEGFARRGLDRQQAAGLMQLSVDLALQARQRFMAEQPETVTAPLVAASVGPYGAMLADGSEYRGDYGLSVAQLMDFHRPRLAVLAASGADLLACETIPCPQEAEALARLLQQEFPATPAWISFSCRDAQHVWQGERLADCMAMLAAVPQVVALGVNCSDPRWVAALLQQAASVTDKPLLAYPNSGEQWDAERKCWHGQASPARFAAQARRWHQAGARLIGGCCRTGPAYIAALRAALDGAA